MLPLLGLTLFTSAFLLFCCEPMVGKMVLPILGGAASVWTTCVLFFQSMLLLGYVYTHFLGKRKNVRDQILIHGALMVIALAFLPMRFSVGTGQQPSNAPISWLLQNLFISVGVPFAVISATAPLLQNWLTKTSSAARKDPYFLYATSNAGSLLALLVYPVLVEPRYGVGEQSRLWLNAYGVLFALVALSAFLIWKGSKGFTEENSATSLDSTPAPTWKIRLYWVAAAFVPSALMLAVTNHISLNIGSVPFLWVIPLAVYLLTFIMAFARRIRLSLAIVSSLATLVLLVLFPIAAVGVPVHATTIWVLMSCHIAILFFGSLLCHSAMADRRPSPKYLTEFYFIVALGGVLGGVFTAMIAPVLFSTVFEYPLLVAAILFFRTSKNPNQRLAGMDAVAVSGFAALVAVAFQALDWASVDVTNFTISWKWDEWTTADIAVVGTQLTLVMVTLLFRRQVLRFALIFAVLLLTYAVVLPVRFEGATRVYIARDFFGVKKVLFDPNENVRKLLHGDTMHGIESLDSSLAGEPLSYYHKAGPIGDVMTLLDERSSQHVAVVGLGTGTIAAYGNPRRRITFFDIDPQVEHIARNLFTFIRRCGSQCDIVIGDGRLAIQARPDHEFDAIILDAFNSDSIPAHLVSREAVRMYMTKLKPDGVLLFHVSNRYLDVESLARVVSDEEGFPAFVRNDDDEEPRGKAASDYVVTVRRLEYLDMIPNREHWEQLARPTNIQPWTDEYSNMMSVIRWK